MAVRENKMVVLYTEVCTKSGLLGIQCILGSKNLENTRGSQHYEDFCYISAAMFE